MRGVQEAGLTFLRGGSPTPLKELVETFTKEVEAYGRKAKKPAGPRRGAGDISAGGDLVEVMQKIEGHLGDLVELQKYKLSVSMEEVREFNTGAKGIPEFCAGEVVSKDGKPRRP